MKIEKEKDELNALMDLELARKEAIHYIMMDTDTFAVSKGCIEIRKRGLNNDRQRITSQRSTKASSKICQRL